MIQNSINPNYISGDNQKYMKMYDWMYPVYDLVEKVGGKLLYGNQVVEMRREMISRLEWKDGLSVLVVSIGTGRDIEFIPKHIDTKSLTITGADISEGMLKKCQKKFAKKLNLSLVQCCAEDLPFDDNAFDIVFSVGGFNFFNDKKRAVAEMMRVAKDSAKILIADETNDLINKHYKHAGYTKKYFNDASVDLSEIENLMPTTERKTKLLWKNRFYCITFRKSIKQ